MGSIFHTTVTLLQSSLRGYFNDGSRQYHKHEKSITCFLPKGYGKVAVKNKFRIWRLEDQKIEAEEIPKLKMNKPL
jgi:hypothetical protein